MVVRHVCAEEQVAELCISKEYNVEHDHEAENVVRALAKSGAQLRHCLIEADILEDLNPAEVGSDCDGIVEQFLVAC